MRFYISEIRPDGGYYCNIGRLKDDTFVFVVISCVQNSVQTVFRVFIHVKT